MSIDRNALKKLIVTELNLPDVSPEEIQDDSPLFGEGLGLDSLDAVELVVILQKAYGVEIRSADEAREAFLNVATLAEFLEARGASSGASSSGP